MWTSRCETRCLYCQETDKTSGDIVSHVAQEVESEVTKLDETEEAQGEGFVQEQANAIKETIESLKETFNLK